MTLLTRQTLALATHASGFSFFASEVLGGVHFAAFAMLLGANTAARLVHELSSFFGTLNIRHNRIFVNTLYPHLTTIYPYYKVKIGNGCSFT